MKNQKLDRLLQKIKAFTKKCVNDDFEAKPIHDKSDYREVQQWVQSITKKYIAFPVGFLLFYFVFFSWAFLISDASVFTYILIIPALILAGWGMANMWIYRSRVFKSVEKGGRAGYQAGEQIQTTHIDITHEYGNTYRATARTENKGCLFMVIGGMIKFLGWAFVCVYFIPFYTLKKLRDSIQNLKQYSAEQE